MAKRITLLACRGSVLLALAILTMPQLTIAAQQRNSAHLAGGRGTVSGTIAFFKAGSRRFAGTANRARLVLTHHGRELYIDADDNGDYYGTQLTSGEYKLKRVVSSFGEELVISSEQHFEFTVHTDKDTRFDVMLVSSGTR